MKREIATISEELTESSQIQLDSTKLLNFYVGDMLSLAQINSDKFRKDCCNFNIKQTVEEVMKIQKHKADTMQISVVAEFVSFDD